MVMISIHANTHTTIAAEDNRTEPSYNYFPGWLKQNAFIFVLDIKQEITTMRLVSSLPVSFSFHPSPPLSIVVNAVQE